MDADAYFWKMKKRPPKNKPRAKPLPKAKDAYLEAEEEFEYTLNVFGLNYALHGKNHQIVGFF